MKSLADDMAAADKRLEDEEIISYVLARLDMDFNPIVSAVAARTEPLSLGELYTQLVSWEQRMDLLHGGSSSSANTATHGGRGGFNRAVVAEDAGTAATVATTTTAGTPGRTTTAINPSASSMARRATPDSAASSVLMLPSPAHQSNPDLPPLRHMGSIPTSTPTLVLPTTS